MKETSWSQGFDIDSIMALPLIKSEGAGDELEGGSMSSAVGEWMAPQVPSNLISVPKRQLHGSKDVPDLWRTNGRRRIQGRGRKGRTHNLISGGYWELRSERMRGVRSNETTLAWVIWDGLESGELEEGGF